MEPATERTEATDEHKEYRYEKVTFGLMMNDMNFAKGTLAAGDDFPPFNLTTTGGAQITNQDFPGKKAMLVVLGSKTCPLTISSIEPLKQLHQKFGEEIEFITVNVREAHPGENCRQPTDFEKKLEHAKELQTRYEIPWIVTSDDIDGSLHRSLDTNPNAAYLVDKEGKIVFRSLVAGDEGALMQAASNLTNGKAILKKQSNAMIGPMMKSIGFISGILKEAGPQAQNDMIRVMPPLIIMAEMSSLFGFLSKPDRGAAVMMSVIGAMVVAAVAIIGTVI